MYIELCLYITFKKGDGKLGCTDINECLADELNDCPSRTNCINTDGDYNCQCKTPEYESNSCSTERIFKKLSTYIM